MFTRRVWLLVDLVLARHLELRRLLKFLKQRHPCAFWDLILMLLSSWLSLLNQKFLFVFLSVECFFVLGTWKQNLILIFILKLLIENPELIFASTPFIDFLELVLVVQDRRTLPVKAYAAMQLGALVFKNARFLRCAFFLSKDYRWQVLCFRDGSLVEENLWNICNRLNLRHNLGHGQLLIILIFLQFVHHFDGASHSSVDLAPVSVGAFLQKLHCKVVWVFGK